MDLPGTHGCKVKIGEEEVCRRRTPIHRMWSTRQIRILQCRPSFGCILDLRPNPTNPFFEVSEVLGLSP